MLSAGLTLAVGYLLQGGGKARLRVAALLLTATVRWLRVHEEHGALKDRSASLMLSSRDGPAATRTRSLSANSSTCSAQPQRRRRRTYCSRHGARSGGASLTRPARRSASGSSLIPATPRACPLASCACSARAAYVSSVRRRCDASPDRSDAGFIPIVAKCVPTTQSPLIVQTSTLSVAAPAGQR